jgi:RNA polymerase sigma-70 factor (ECF subfamily)
MMPPRGRGSERHEDDYKLVQRMIAGEEGAWRQMLDLYTPQLFTAIYRAGVHQGRKWSSHEVRDIFQEVVVCLLEDQKKRLRSYRGQASLLVWMWSVARNLAIDHLRRKGISTVSIGEPVLSEEGERRVRKESLLPEDFSQQQREEVRAVREEIQSTLLALTSRDRLILLLAYEEGLPLAKIAELLFMTESGASRAVARARERFRTEFTSRKKR